MTKILNDEQLDDVARALLTLARELWVVRERQRALEELLEERGIHIGEQLKNYQPTLAQLAANDADRRRFVQEIVAQLVPPADRQ
jgi:ABC-type transporter Mla subunit MlaD